MERSPATAVSPLLVCGTEGVENPVQQPLPPGDIKVAVADTELVEFLGRANPYAAVSAAEVVEYEKLAGVHVDAVFDGVELETVSPVVRSLFGERGELHPAEEVRVGRRGER